MKLPPGEAMPREYFTTQFTTPAIPKFPDEFAIITGYATTGERWPDELNRASNAALLEELRSRGIWIHPMTGHSPDLDHAEPGWAAALSFDDACNLGQRFKQIAVYYIRGDELSVSYCDGRRGLVRVGRFRERVKSEE